MVKKKFQQNSTTIKIDFKGNTKQLSPNLPKKEEPKYTFGDVSVERDESAAQRISEEELIDSKLASLHLCRKKIPKDGACLFRAISDQLLHSQSLHFKVRQQCIDFMWNHQEDYEPFTCVSGLPFDHYCFEMRKVNTWGGQVELQAISVIFRVNFSIYSTQSEEPTIVDNGFSQTILLCFYGNHYDAVYSEVKMNAETFCQGVIFGVLDKILGVEKKESYEYKNIGWECWIDELRAQEKKDELMAQKMLTDFTLPLIVPSYAELTGFYRKKNDKHLPKVSDPRSNNKGNNKSRLPLEFGPTQGDTLDDALVKIALMEENEQERLREIGERDLCSFPALPVIAKQDIVSFKEINGDNTFVRSWKELFREQPQIASFEDAELIGEILHPDYPAIRVTPNLRKYFEFSQDDAFTFGSLEIH